MRANRAYELKVSRGGGRFDPARVDSIEVLEIDTGEIALFWDLEPRATRKMARALRADLAQLDADEFLAKWQRYQGA